MYPPEVKRRALRLYATGKSLREVAAELRVSITTLWRWAREAGLMRDRSTSIQMALRKRVVSELGPFRGLPRGSRRGGVTSAQSAHPFTGKYLWPSDSRQIRGFVEMAWKDGWLPNSILGGRLSLKRYEKFVRRKFRMELDRANSHEFVSYKTYLVRNGKKRSTLHAYLGLIVAYYRLKAEHSQSPQGLDQYHRVWTFGRVPKIMGEHWMPFAPDTLQRIMSEAYRGYRWGPPGDPAKEDYPLLMTLLYTGGRAQFYGLKVKDVDFEKMVIRTGTKGGQPLVIPIHPALALILREHLILRPYQSDFLFRLGKDPNSYTGSHQNCLNAWNACQRAKKVAQLDETVNPQRFRVTLATLGRRLGLDPQVLQALLGHRHLSLTLDVYSRVQPDEAGMEFSKIDLTKNLHELAAEPPADSTEALLRLIPRDKTEAVNTVLRGLIGLMQGTSLDAQSYNREVRRFRQLLLPEAGA